jgi:hypothetical protein
MSGMSHTPDHSDEPGAVASQALATRLLVMHNPFTQAPARLVARQVAPEFPAEVPLPEGSYVLGTLVAERNVIVLFDVDLPLERLDAFYRERLPALGWSIAEQPGPQRGGFLYPRPGPPSVSTLFCRGETSPSLRVAASQPDEEAGGPVQASLQLMRYETPQQSPCALERMAPTGRMARSMRETWLPALRAPRGATHERVSGGGGDGHLLANADLDVTGIDPSAVGRHYNDQLAQGGWTLTEEGAAPSAAWSTWTFMDEEGTRWAALFFALQHPAVPGHYLLTLRADRTD